MSRPKIVITAYGEAIITFPFHRGLVEAIKREIPSYARSYEPSTKAWTIDQPYINAAGALVESVYPDVEVEDYSVHFSPPQSDNRSPDEYKTLHLLPSAPPELVESAYRCLSRLHHPDRGGDPERMIAINSAVETIRRRLA